MLGLITTNNKKIIFKKNVVEPKNYILQSALKSESVIMVSNMLTETPQIRPIEIGRALAEHFCLPWSEPTMIRRGSALKRWAKWVKEN